MVVSYKIISDKRYPRRQICNFSSIFFNFLCPENIAKALMTQKNRARIIRLSGLSVRSLQMTIRHQGELRP